MSRKKSEMKQWAKAYMKGVENTLFPSFSPDLKELDEDGIRWDVRQSIKHGFFSMMCATETGLRLDEAKRFVEVAADEAQGQILVTTSLILNSFDENMELMVHAEKVGLDGVLLGYPPTFHPGDKEEVYEVTKRFCDATNMHVTLYPSPHFHFYRFHNSGFPPDVLVRLADIPNVVAIKIGELGLFYEAHRLIGDRVLVGCPVERFVPPLITGFGMQWMGAGCYEVFQSPEKPYLVEYFDLLLNGSVDAAMEIYWKITPMRNIFEQQFNQTVMTGTYNWYQQKYYQWCVGGNGGPTRQPAMKIHQWEADAVKMGYFTIDITPRENDEEFFVGRTNYARMMAAAGEADGQEAVPAIKVIGKAVTPEGDPRQLAVDYSQQLQDMLAETQADLNRIPALIRPMAAGGFKSKSGQSIQDWQKTARDLTRQIQATDFLDERARAQFKAAFERLKEPLTGLARYYAEAPAEARRNIKDPQDLERMKQQMAAREGIVRALIAALEEISE